MIKVGDIIRGPYPRHEVGCASGNPLVGKVIKVNPKNYVIENTYQFRPEGPLYTYKFNISRDTAVLVK